MLRKNFVTLFYFPILLSSCCYSAIGQDAAKSRADEQSYTLKMPVDEVKVTFHVSDQKGDPLQQLKKDQIQLFDNGKLQDRTVAFHEYRDLPIRVGFLLDNSPSMQTQLDRSQAIASQLIKEFFRPQSDRAFTMGFGVDTRVTQDWTKDADSVSKGITAGLVKEPSESDGTAMFDAIYKACKDKFSTETADLTGNFILLFTDGEDTSSRVWEGSAVDMCQRARTAIYVFIPEWKTRATRGQQIVEDLVSKTGGRVFYQSRQSVHDALATAVSDMRYQYELIYSPPGLKRDGAFHHIKMKCVVAHAQIQVRSGYYAYAKPRESK
jgi:Ca-activated chloride channel homolog